MGGPKTAERGRERKAKFGAVCHPWSAAAAFDVRSVHARRKTMPSRHPLKRRVRVLTLHDWEAKHYVIAAVIILVVVGMFAYSWS
jgi:hypothetical protein